jgi:hypothetical protein
MVEILGVNQVGGTSPLERSSRSQNRKSADSAPAKAGDSLNISSDARLAHQVEHLAGAAQSSEDVRIEVVNQARADVEGDSLLTDAAIRDTAEKVADQLI